MRYRIDENIADIPVQELRIWWYCDYAYLDPEGDWSWDTDIYYLFSGGSKMKSASKIKTLKKPSFNDF